MKTPPCQFNRMLGKMKVLSMEAHTGLSMEDLSARLRAYFGEGGLGLELKVNGPARYNFQSDRGFVSAVLGPAGDKTLLRITTNDWAVQVKTFVSELP